MKRVLCLMMAAIMAVALAACGAPAANDASTPASIAEPTPESVVVFTDPVLEAMVRTAMNKPEGDITPAEAETVTELKLNIEWQQQIPPETQIQNISGLENFKNLETLELSFHNIKDISPLAGLTKLTSLSLGGNPVADITPLSGMTALRGLMLFNCAANDYATLSKFVNLDFLMLDYSTFTDASVLSGLTRLTHLSLSHTQVKDVSPLAGLASLRRLFLAESPVEDYSPLVGIYPNLEESDFALASSLRELGFLPKGNTMQVESYKTDQLIVQVHHAEWGAQENPDEVNMVLLFQGYGTENDLGVICYPETKTYLVFSHGQDFRYTFDGQSKEFHFEYGQEAATAFLSSGYPEPDGALEAAPIDEFARILNETFGVSADVLYALPREIKVVDASSLLALGFTAEQKIASYLYVQQEPGYYSVEIHNPEWGEWEEGGDVRFFTPLSDECRIVITYFAAEKKYLVKADDNSGGGAAFEFFVDRKESVDGWCSDNGLTVEEYFARAYNDPNIEDVHVHSIELVLQYIRDTFGLEIEELYALPVE